jgi:hypothetical protein
MQSVPWRDELFSDWIVMCVIGTPLTHSFRVDSKQYKLHRIHLASGQNMSHFFRAQFTIPTGDLQKGTTDLSHLPQACKDVWERALDFLYSTSTEVVCPAKEVVPLLALADFLQVSTLVDASCEF